jgi:hypothetical protein
MRVPLRRHKKSWRGPLAIVLQRIVLRCNIVGLLCGKPGLAHVRPAASTERPPQRLCCTCAVQAAAEEVSALAATQEFVQFSNLDEE